MIADDYNNSNLIKDLKSQLDSAYSKFNEAVKDEDIDISIFEINLIEKRIDSCMKNIKEDEKDGK